MRPLMPPVQTPDNLFHDGNPLTGELGTIVDAEHLNNVQGAVRDAQSELITVLNAAGINVDPSKQNQLLTALKALLLSRSNPFGDIKSDGTVKTALENLGLSDLVLAGVGAGSLGTTGYAEIPLVISGAKKMLLLCWGMGSTGSNGSFTQSFAKAFPTAVLCKLVTNGASTSPSGFAGASTTLSTISIYSASAAGTPSSSGVAYNYLAIGY
ncbi:gp53-like domain-containing protein [Enterobacter asburiae]|uniref:gp53-like domain-containing protein n=1 Tax=Enterobacter asburiae TaxID=61645 RepID=UPI0034E263FA